MQGLQLRESRHEGTRSCSSNNGRSRRTLPGQERRQGPCSEATLQRKQASLLSATCSRHLCAGPSAARGSGDRRQQQISLIFDRRQHSERMATEVLDLGSPSALRPQPEGYRQLTDGFNAIDVAAWAQQRVCLYSGSSSLYARHGFRAGEVLSSFGAKATLSTPNYLTVQVGEQRHIMLQPDWLQYINHSCDPNVAFDTTTLQLVALKDIQAGDELVFFYNSTEWELSAPFACRCNTSACCGTVRGAKHMTPAQLSHYRLTDFIKGKLSSQQSA